jgi:superfamily I DNA and/or RNA helicase
VLPKLTVLCWFSVFVIQHEAIAAFPSAQFYNGQLTSGKEEQSTNSVLKFWPNGRSKPIAFVHIVGCEQALSMSTSDAGEQSKYNLSEVDLVVS